MDKNRQEGKWLVIEHKALNWAKTNTPPPPGGARITLMVSHGRCDDYNIAFIIIMIVKQGRFECIEYMDKGDELYVVFTSCTKFFKYDPC
jgi:hypothetical protein